MTCYLRLLSHSHGRTEQLQQRLCDMKSLNYSCLSCCQCLLYQASGPQTPAVRNYPENVQDQVNQTVQRRKPGISISKICKRFHYADESEKFSPSPSRGPAACLLPCLAGLSQAQIAHPGRRQLSCCNTYVLVPHRSGFILSTQ